MNTINYHTLFLQNTFHMLSLTKGINKLEMKNMHMENNSELVHYFSKSRNHIKTTEKSYRIIINQYANFNGLTMAELLDEAEDEEKQKIRWKDRKLKKRLIDYRAFLYDKYTYSTAKSRFSRLCSFYRHFEIEIHDLPKISTINVEKTHMGFKDLPTKDILKKALKISSPLIRAIILFMSSSGTARVDAMNLTIQSFINATNNAFVSYHNSNDIYDVLNELKGKEDIVPIFEITRQKTNKFYYTCCSPEAVSEIVDYLASRSTVLKPESPLFDIGVGKFIDSFRHINDTLGLGRLSNGNRRFTSHMLRKFHSTSLWNEKVSTEIVDALQGRGKDQTHSSYFYENPLKLREIYIENMACLTINVDVTKLDFKSDEFKKLENENELLKEENEKYKQVVENIDDRIERKIQEAMAVSSPGLSDEEFEELFS